MQIICTTLQTYNHASTPSLNFLQAGCSSWCPTNSVKALKWQMHWQVQSQSLAMLMLHSMSHYTTVMTVSNVSAVISMNQWNVASVQPEHPLHPQLTHSTILPFTQPTQHSDHSDCINHILYAIYIYIGLLVYSSPGHAESSRWEFLYMYITGVSYFWGQVAFLSANSYNTVHVKNILLYSVVKVSRTAAEVHLLPKPRFFHYNWRFWSSTIC